MSVIVYSNTAAKLEVQTNRSSNGSLKSLDKIETPVVSSYIVSGNISNISTKQNQATVNSAINISEYGGSAYFNGANDYIIISPSNINTYANAATTSLTLNAGYNINNTGIAFTPSSNNLGNTYAAYFSGNDYVTSANLTTLTLAGDFTMEAYVMLTGNSVANIYSIVDTRTANNANNYWWGLYYQTNTWRPVFYGTSGYFANATTTQVQANTWHHVAVTRASGTIRFFVDGVTDGSTYSNSSTLTPTGASARIGSDISGANSIGYISNLRIINGTSLYSANFTPPSLPLTLSTPNTTLLTFQNSTFVDNGNNTFTVTPANASMAIAQSNNIFIYYPSNYMGNTGTGYANAVALNPLVANGFNGYYGVFQGNNYISVSANSSLALGTNNFCIECWVYPTANSSASGGRIWSLGTASGQLVQLYQGSAIGIVYPIGTSTNSTLSTTTTLPLNTWSHLVVQRTSGTNVNILRNGAIIANIATTSTIWNTLGTPALYIGSDNTTNTKFTGYISNFRIINGNSVYTANTIALPTSNLTSNSSTMILALQTSSATTDSGSNNFTITSSNTTTMVQTGASNGTIGVSAFDLSLHDYTMEGWFYLNDYQPASNGGVIVQLSPTDTAAARSYPTLNVTNTFIYVYSNTTTAAAVNGPAPPVKQWHHFAIQRASGNTSLYVDGIFYGQANVSIAGVYGHGNMVFSAGYDIQTGGTGDHLNGIVSNVRIIKGAALYSGSNTVVNNFVVPTAPLTSISNSSSATVLLTLQNTTPVDNSPYAWKTGYTSTAANTTYLANIFSTNNVWFNSSFNTGATVDAWIYPTSVSGNATIVDSFLANTAGAGNWKIFLNSGVLTYYYDGNNAITGPTLSANTWTHVCVTRDSANVYLYANSVLANTIAVSNAFGNTSTSLYVGASQQGGPSNYFSGYISNLRVANATLTPSNTTGNNIITGPVNPYTNGNMLVLNRDITSPSYSWHFDGTRFFSRTGYGGTVSQLINCSNGDFTVEAWINMPVLPTTDSFAYASPYSNPYIILSTSNVTLLQASFAIGNTKLMLVSNTTVYTSGSTHGILPNKWYHVAFTRQSGTLNFWVNGTAAGSNSSASANIGATPSIVSIGGDGLANANFIGYINSVKLYTVGSRYSTSFTPPVNPTKQSTGYSYWFDAYNPNGYTPYNEQMMNLPLLGSNGNVLPFGDSNPYGFQTITDSGPYQYSITYPKVYGPQMQQFNPWANSSTVTAVGNKQKVIASNSAILSYNNTSISANTNAKITITTKYNAANQEYVASNIQTVTINSNVTPVTTTGGTNITEAWY
jgi:hypothetical protein